LTTIPLLEAMVDRAGQIVARIRTETDTGSQPYETATRALKTLEGRLSMAEAKYQAAINDWGFHRRLKKANFEAGLIFLACPVFGVVAWVVGAKLRDDVLFHAVGIVLVLAGVAGAPLRLWLTKRTAPTP
jgi:hypothetical protein